MKQKTLEEAAANYLHRVADGKRTTGYADEDFIEGAKWQQEKNKYSEEEVKQLFKNIIDEIEVRKQNIISNSDKMSVHLLEGGCMAFESLQDVIKEQFEKFKKK